MVTFNVDNTAELNLIYLTSQFPQNHARNALYYTQHFYLMIINYNTIT